MKVVLVAVNARYAHTAPSVRVLKAYVCDPRRNHPFPSRDLSIYETHINRPVDDAVRDLSAWNADVYGFSCAIWNIQTVLRICSDLHRIRPDARILLGGPEVTGKERARQLLEHHPEIDWVIRGEGEAPLASLLTHLNSDRALEGAVPGLVRRSDGILQDTPPGPAGGSGRLGVSLCRSSGRSGTPPSLL